MSNISVIKTLNYYSLFITIYTLLLIRTINSAECTQIEFYGSPTNEIIPLTGYSTTFQTAYHFINADFRAFYFFESKTSKVNTCLHNDQIEALTKSSTRYVINESEYLFSCSSNSLFYHFHNKQKSLKGHTVEMYYQYPYPESLPSILKCDIDFNPTKKKLLITVPYNYNNVTKK